MKIKFEKTMKIASELLSYCHHFGATEYHLDILQEETAVTIAIRAKPENITEDELSRVREALTAPRQRDVEQDYWELIGETDFSSEIPLVGMLCDDATVEYRDKELLITLVRHD